MVQEISVSTAARGIHHHQVGRSLCKTWTGSASLGKFKAAVDRLTALRSRTHRLSKVRVVHVSPQSADAGNENLSLIDWEAERVTEE